MHIRILLLFLLLGGSFPLRAQEALHRRLIVVSGAAPLSFDPLEGRRASGTMAQLHTLTQQGRMELGEGNLFVADVAPDALPVSYKIYETLRGDSLICSARKLTGCRAGAQADSLLSHFGLTRAAVRDSLADSRGREWLVADRYTVAGESAVRVRRISANSVASSREYNERMEPLRRKFERFFQEPVSVLDTTVHSRDCYFGPSAFASLFHRFQKSVSGASVSLFAPPQADVVLQSGDLSLADLLRPFRYDNELVRVRLTGAQLQEFLEELYGMRYFTIKGPDSDLVRTRVPYYLHDDVSGLRLRVDLTQRSGKRVRIYEMENGAKFDREATYTVVMNSFRARSFREKGIPVEVVAADYRIALAGWLLAHPYLSPRASDNWSPAPERWVESIRRREYDKVFK